MDHIVTRVFISIQWVFHLMLTCSIQRDASSQPIKELEMVSVTNNLDNRLH